MVFDWWLFCDRAVYFCLVVVVFFTWHGSEAVILANNSFLGDVPVQWSDNFPPTWFDYNCLTSCTYLRQRWCPCGANLSVSTAPTPSPTPSVTATPTHSTSPSPSSTDTVSVTPTVSASFQPVSSGTGFPTWAIGVVVAGAVVVVAGVAYCIRRRRQYSSDATVGYELYGGPMDEPMGQ